MGTKVSAIAVVVLCASLYAGDTTSALRQQQGCGSRQCAEFVNPLNEDAYVQVRLGGRISDYNMPIGRCSAYTSIKTFI
jgi:hypothetical protein